MRKFLLIELRPTNKANSAVVGLLTVVGTTPTGNGVGILLGNGNGTLQPEEICDQPGYGYPGRESGSRLDRGGLEMADWAQVAAEGRLCPGFSCNFPDIQVF